MVRFVQVDIRDRVRSNTSELNEVHLSGEVKSLGSPFVRRHRIILVSGHSSMTHDLRYGSGDIRHRVTVQSTETLYPHVSEGVKCLFF